LPLAAKDMINRVLYLEMDMSLRFETMPSSDPGQQKLDQPIND
jgi:hypothetical protein